MSYKVYISHSAKDAELAKDLSRRLCDRDPDVRATMFMHEAEADTPAHLRSLIKLHIQDSDEVVVLLTDNSANSGWVAYEMGVADSLDKRLTPVVVNEGVEQHLPMLGKNVVKYADLPRYIASLKRRAKAA